MGTYYFTRNGQEYTVTGPDHDTAWAEFDRAVPVTDEVDTVGEYAKDVGNSVAAGVAQGASELLGLPGTMYDALQQGIGWVGNKAYKAVTGEEPTRDGTEGFIERMVAPNEQGRYGDENPVTGNKIRNMVADLSHGRSEYVPQTVAGEYSRTVGRYAPGTILFGGANPRNLLQYGLAPALAEETAGQATKGSKWEPTVRIGASFLAPFAVEGTINKLVTPNVARPDPVRARHLRTMDDEGVELTAGQRLNSKNLRRKEAMRSFGAAEDFDFAQKGQYTNAIMRRIGEDVDQVDERVLNRAARRLSEGFQRTLAGTTLMPDRALSDDLRGIWGRYNEQVMAGDRTNDLRRLLTDVTTEVQRNGSMTGEYYQALRSKAVEGIMRNRAAGGAGRVNAESLSDFVDALDDAFERSMMMQNNPRAAVELRRLRRSWRDMQTVTRAAGGRGEGGALASGHISPAKLREAVEADTPGGRKNFARRGGGRFRDLAIAGEATMTPLQSSSTSERGVASRIFRPEAGVGSAAGGYLGSFLGPMGAAGGAALGGLLGNAASPMVGEAMLSRAGRHYLANQLVPRQSVSQIAEQGLIPSLIAAQRQEVERNRKR
jgi:hypothetical protein